MNAQQNFTRNPLGNISRELAVRGTEAALLAAMISAQQAALPGLCEAIDALHQRAGDERRAIESGATDREAAA